MIFELLIVYQLKHFLADYPLQGKYMLGKFKSGWGWILPLAVHSGIHGKLTALIAWAFGRGDIAIGLGLIDFWVHFTMDRIKASPNLLGRFKALSGNEMNRLISMGPLDDGSGRIPSVTPYGEADRNKQFRNNTYFWWSLGLDQMVHHLTHYYLIWRIIS